MRLPFAILGFAHDKADVQAAIDAASYLAEWQIRRGYAPLWWESTARYQREQHTTLPGVERIQLPEELEAMGGGDCDDHAPALCGSLRAIGVPARALVIESPGIGYHVVVEARNRDGRRVVIDPSARRGMLIGDSHGERRRHRRGRARAALLRAQRLVAEVARLNPASAAARALAGEASRLLDMHAAERQREANEGDDESEGDE